VLTFKRFLEKWYWVIWKTIKNKLHYNLQYYLVFTRLENRFRHCIDRFKYIPPKTILFIEWAAPNLLKKNDEQFPCTHISKSRHVVNLICTIFSQIFSTLPKLPIKPTQVFSQPVLVGRLEKRPQLPLNREYSPYCE